MVCLRVRVIIEKEPHRSIQIYNVKSCVSRMVAEVRGEVLIDLPLQIVTLYCLHCKYLMLLHIGKPNDDPKRNNVDEPTAGV